MFFTSFDEVPKAAPLTQDTPFIVSDRIIWSMQANVAPAYQPDAVIESGSPDSCGRLFSYPWAIEAIDAISSDFEVFICIIIIASNISFI